MDHRITKYIRLKHHQYQHNRAILYSYRHCIQQRKHLNKTELYELLIEKDVALTVRNQPIQSQRRQMERIYRRYLSTIISLMFKRKVNHKLASILPYDRRRYLPPYFGATNFTRLSSNSINPTTTRVII